MEELKSILRKIGMSNYKIETYVALLKIKSGTVQQIAKNSRVPSCKIYENLKWLHENGYITMISQKPLSYRANNPKSIINSEIEQDMEKLKKLKGELEIINLNLPTAEKNIIQITATRDGYYKKVKESVAGVKKSIFYTAKNWRIDSELIRLLGQKIKQGVIIRALGPVDKENKSKIKWLRDAGVKIKNFSPKEAHYAIYDNSLVIISLRKEPKQSDYSAIWIKSETIAEILTNHFNSIWKNV